MAIDEQVGRVIEVVSSRQMAYGALDLIVKAAWLEIVNNPVQKLAVLCMYSDWRRRQMKRDSPRRKPVDVAALTDKWVEVIVGLSTAHEHADFTAADYQTDQLLGPLMVAPIVQIREFASALSTRLREDPRVPFLIWSGFQRIVEPVVINGKDGDLIQLKTELATEIAQMVEQNLDRGELVAALAGALQWRSGKSLEGVKRELSRGTKPKIQGRESCLFLEVGEEMVVI